MYINISNRTKTIKSQNQKSTSSGGANLVYWWGNERSWWGSVPALYMLKNALL